MADKFFLCIIEAMDCLWFHKIVLFSHPITTSSVLPNEETSTDESPSPKKQVSLESSSISLQDDINSCNQQEKEERRTRKSLSSNRTRSHSSSPSTQKHPRKHRKAIGTRRVLEKSMSCRTLEELELEEVRGFMDLGFKFNKEHISPRMMSVVPGLQRLGVHQNEQKTDFEDGTETVGDKKIEENEQEEHRDIMRPYLSEAWLIKRPDSPLLNLKVPKLCSSSHMKKHLRFWAKTVASEIHQE